MPGLSICSLNVRGLRNSTKHNVLFEWLKSKKFDIICLQETYCTTDFVNQFNRHWDGPVFHSCSDSNHSKGVAILINPKQNVTVIEKVCDEYGRKLLVKIKINDEIFNIVNVYFPNSTSERKIFIRSLEHWLYSNISDNYFVIMAGDFNTALTKINRKSGSYDPCSPMLKKLANRLMLHDIWKFKNPEQVKYTWENRGNASIQSRIDYIFVTKKFNAYY